MTVIVFGQYYTVFRIEDSSALFVVIQYHHEPFAEVYEPFAEVAHTEGSTKTPWRVHEASSKGPWMNCMLLLDHDCNRVWSILYCF